MYCKRCKGMGLVTKIKTVEKLKDGVHRTYEWVKCPECRGKGLPLYAAMRRAKAVS